MQKQIIKNRFNLDKSIFKNKSLKKVSKNQKNKKKALFLFKKFLKYRSYRILPYFHRCFLKIKQKFITYLTFKVTFNNIFFNLKNLKTNTTIFSGSGEMYKIKISKKTLKYVFKILINLYLSKIKKYLIKKKNIFIVVTAPKKIKKQLIFFLKKSLKKLKLNIILKINPKKCFNGCRPGKQTRKKRKSFQLLKKF